MRRPSMAGGISQICRRTTEVGLSLYFQCAVCAGRPIVSHNAYPLDELQGSVAKTGKRERSAAGRLLRVFWKLARGSYLEAIGGRGPPSSCD